MSAPEAVDSFPISQQIESSGAEAALGKRMLRKAGWRLIPLLGVCYMVAYMDRANLSYAALQMNRDLHFNANVYGLGAGIFFISYAVCELPSNYLLLRFGARRWIARIMLTWGILAAAMTFVRSPASFYTMRFLLGVAEAGFFPGVIYYLSLWFPQEMRARAISRFYVSLPISNVLMGVIAGSLLNLNGRLGLRGWQWLFLLEALPAVVLAVVVFYALPDGPETAEWIKPRERAWLLRRLAEDGRQIGGRIDGRLDGRIDGSPDSDHDSAVADSLVKPPGLPAVLSDIRVILIGLFFFCTLGASYAYAFSAPSIVVAVTGTSANKAGFLLAGMAVFGAAAMLLGSSYSDRTGNKILPVVLGSLLMAAGFAVSGQSHTALIVLPALALAMIGYYGMQGPALSLVTVFLEGAPAAIGIAVINTVAIVGGSLGPMWMGWAITRTGDYRFGLTMLWPPCVVAAGLILLLRARTPPLRRAD